MKTLESLEEQGRQQNRNIDNDRGQTKSTRSREEVHRRTRSRVREQE